MDATLPVVKQLHSSFSRTIGSEDIGRVIRHLIETPYTTAKDISIREGLDADDINLIYKIIRSSDEWQARLYNSPSRDYYDTVKNHFGKNAYTVVFFVGLYCTSRCHFCPSVKIHKNGYRELLKYKSGNPGQKKLDATGYARIFEDLNHLQRQGKRVGIKISGGLEPFTDPKTVGRILDLARETGIESTIFTNGMLLKLGKNVDLALRSDSIRISLSTASAVSFDTACYGEHEDNKKIVGYDDLKSIVGNLIARRDQSGAKTRIGINTVAGEFNFHELPALIREVSALGVDYLEVKGEYFDIKTNQWFQRLDEAVAEVSAEMKNNRIGVTKVTLTGSLLKDNFFNRKPDGFCIPSDQSAFKMFINPFGECTPVHYWAYPNGEDPRKKNFHLGVLKDGAGLLDFIDNGQVLPNLSYDKLNPFELILSLESARLRSDAEFGILPENNPYLAATHCAVPGVNPMASVL